MNRKLGQKLALGYYNAKFRTLGLLSPSLAARSAFTLFCTPYSGKPKRKVPPVFNRARPLSLPVQDLTVKGFSWEPEQPAGGTVLICHGFDSSSYSFDRYITPLLRAGYRVMAFDAPGHGHSDGRTINALLYKKTILAIEEKFGPLNVVMAHSLGGLAAALAMEEMPLQTERKLVLIAPATETGTAIHQFLRYVPLRPRVQQAFMGIIENLAGKPVSWFSVARAIQQIEAQVLWLHDQDDQVCPLHDVAPVIDANPGHVRFYLTKGLGHSRIYKDNKVVKTILQFITGREVAAPPATENDAAP